MPGVSVVRPLTYDRAVTFPRCDRPDEALLDFLRELGASEKLLEEAKKRGHLGGLAGDLVLAKGSDMDIADLARATGLGEEKVASMWRELGLRPDPGDRRFGRQDQQVIELLASASELKIEGAELLRVIGASLARVADAAVALYVQNVEDGADAVQVGSTLLGPVLAQHLRDAIARQRTAQEGVTDRIVGRMAVGFVDMVGSTQAANQLSSRALLQKVSSFESRAYDLASEHGGWIVKHVGDEVMFVALNGDVGCRLALAMTEEFTAAGIQPRAGVAFGEVITFHGDYYGPVVNLASRLTDQSVPGEVLVDSGVRTVAEDASICFEPAGRRQLKGFDEPVAVFSLERSTEFTSGGPAITQRRPLLLGDPQALASQQIPHGAER
jgi:adenylate cyclase